MNHPELNVSALTIRNSFFYGYFFASDSVVTTDEIWGFAADDFKAIFLNVALPRFAVGKRDFLRISYPTFFHFDIENIFSFKPSVINQVVLCIAYP